ncbi:MAG: glycosyltransferase [Solirubrobacterales bacterium]
MRILIFHGYLLRGTGSNVYNAELARALAAAGHDVHVLCQDRNPAELEFVDAVGEWSDSGLTVEAIEHDHPDEWGSCSVYRPAIGEILPVYVADRYEGVTAKTFPELSDAELDHYIETNVAAVREIDELVKPDCALANHMVMGPAILARALDGRIPYAVKIHGSAMEYTVRPNPRFLPYAIEGIEPCATLLVGSRHIAERAWDTLAIDGLKKRTFLGPPGVDIEAFVPRDRLAARAGLEQLAQRIEAMPRRGYGPDAAAATGALYRLARGEEHQLSYDAIAGETSTLQTAYDTAGIDAEAPAALRALAASGDSSVVLYVGKLIVSKGVDLLLAAWPLVRERYPNAQLAITGFGAYREGLEMLLMALSDGDLEMLRWIARGGRAFEGGGPDELHYLAAFLDDLSDAERERYLAAAAGISESVHWFGRLEHDTLIDVIPCADVQVIPSTFPEAFGMVAAEAGACGVPPICASHSGLAEVTEVLEHSLSGATASLLSFRLGDRSVSQLAARINGVLALDKIARADLSVRLSNTSRKHFSWTGVASSVATAALGRHDGLRRP